MKKTGMSLLLCMLFICGCTATPAAPTAQPSPRAPFTGTATLSSSISPEWIQPASVAGSWYPADPQELADTVDGYLNVVTAVEGKPIALVVPHAGYPFSGPVAAYGFKQMEGGDYEVAVIIAADHQPPISNPISVWAKGGFATPLGVVPVDEDLAQALIKAEPRISFDSAVFKGEHPIEIELPFIQRVCPACKIVPVLMGTEDEEDIQALAKALLAVLPGRKAVVIASSDLSHYPTYKDALSVDHATLSAIETGNQEQLHKTTVQMMSQDMSNLVTCACGESAIRVTMLVAQGLGADRVTTLHYANSGDSPQGDKSQVVGYGAVMFWHNQPSDLTNDQKTTLLKLAREAISTYLTSRKISDYITDDLGLLRKSGAFVTLKEKGELRGCIGQMQSELPLYRLVQEMAVAAATQDPRFQPLAKPELSQVTIEISVLSPLQLVTDLKQIEIGKHGLLIEQNGQRGVFLPQVPVEQGWDLGAYLENLCYKAGLPGGCWQNNPTLYSFTALVFGEK